MKHYEDKNLLLDFNGLEARFRFPHFLRVVQLTAVCILFVHATAAGELHDSDKPSDLRPEGSADIVRQAPCAASPAKLANFANGESYDYGHLINFVTTENCQRASAAISRAAIRSGVSFNESYPFKLDLYVPATRDNNLGGRESADAALAKRIPTLLSQSSLSSKELLPIAGQLALLSPKASRATLVKIAQEQLKSADGVLQGQRGLASVEAGSPVAKRMAINLLRLGMNRSVMTEAFADSVHEMAVLAQADSLSKIFRSLGAAAQANNALVATFNRSADALNKGVQKNAQMLSAEGKASMLKAVFTAASTASQAEDLFRSGLLELNEALTPLINGYALNDTQLKTVWKEVLSVLSQSPSQTALAEAMSLSLTPEVVFLPEADREALVTASQHHRSLAVALQDNYLSAFHKLWSNYQNEKISSERFMETKTKFLTPWVVSILELGSGLLTRRWLKQVVEYRLIPDEEMEAKFPLMVLEHLRRKDEASDIASRDTAVETKVASLAENMASLWALSQVHIPALQDWLKRNPGQ